MAKNKQPKTKFQPSSAKEPRVAPSRIDPQSNPVWRFRKLDLGGPWCFRPMGAADLERVLRSLQEFESMRWSEILGRNSHEIPIENLTTEAQNRLGKLKLDDVDAVLSIRITGAERVFAVRLDGAAYLLWWDPRHEVCPSNYKDN